MVNPFESSSEMSFRSYSNFFFIGLLYWNFHLYTINDRVKSINFDLSHTINECIFIHMEHGTERVGTVQSLIKYQVSEQGCIAATKTKGDLR